VWIRSRRHESNRVLVAVQDSGIGIEPGNLDKIFDAFYTTKPQGMGMGLAISRSIVESHGGELRAVPNDGPGMRFELALPRPRRSLPQQAREIADGPAVRSPTSLFVAQHFSLRAAFAGKPARRISPLNLQRAPGRGRRQGPQPSIQLGSERRRWWNVGAA
jgi:hypothetical protein